MGCRGECVRVLGCMGRNSWQQSAQQPRQHQQPASPAPHPQYTHTPPQRCCPTHRRRSTDGDRVAAGTRFGHVRGSARSILVAERIALNFMQRMSGIATATAALVAAAAPHGPARILDTRKTVPGLRLLDKWATLIGGGSAHRMGLFDMMMIKDNHIAAAGSVRCVWACCVESRGVGGGGAARILVSVRGRRRLEAPGWRA